MAASSSPVRAEAGTSRAEMASDAPAQPSLAAASVFGVGSAR